MMIPNPLTLSEMLVVQAMLTGHTTNKAIAEELILSPRTVQAHLKNIYKKLGVSDRVGMSVHVMSAGWFDGNATEMVRRPRSNQRKTNEPRKIATPREAQIERMVAQGMHNTEIAQQLKISRQTVKNHMTNILRRYRVSDRTELAILLTKKGNNPSGAAIYNGDEPQNLEAAALDALEWLRFWADYGEYVGLGQPWSEQRRRMERTIRTLQVFLPDKVDK